MVQNRKNIKKSLKRALASARYPQNNTAVVWTGPSDPGPQGGITQSLLSQFIVCRERFRLLVVEGLQPAPSFNHRIEYGSMWHICEEALAAGKTVWTGRDQWLDLERYCRQLCEKYRTQQEQIVHWMNVCKAQFPVYADYWRKNEDVQNRVPLVQEQAFRVPYNLPSGRTVYLRGKWDSVDLIGNGKNAGVYLQENKTKGDIKEDQLKRQLQSGFDLQTMIYLIALSIASDDHAANGSDGFNRLPQEWPDPSVIPIRGVRYNVVRRPLSGGKYSIRQKTGQTAEEFYGELGSKIASDPNYFFMRWKVEIIRQDLDRFRHECLDPVLEQLCDWWEHIIGASSRQSCFDSRPGRREYMVHYRTPYGIYNVLAEGGSADVDEYLNTGSEMGLTRCATLFPELD